MRKRINKIHVYDDLQSLSEAAAEQFVRIGNQVLQERDRFAVALSGGSTPKRLFQLLTKPPYRDKLDWSKVVFLWGDERPVPPDHPDSNYRMACEALLEPLGIKSEQICRIPAELENPESVTQEYQACVEKLLGKDSSGETPILDLVLLGMGNDGHTASLFPATSALLETKQWFVSNVVVKLETTRYTMTPMALNRARNIFFLVSGSDKSLALHAVLEGPIDTQKYPAQLIRPANGSVNWFVDQDAASKLTAQS